MQKKREEKRKWIVKKTKHIQKMQEQVFQEEWGMSWLWQVQQSVWEIYGDFPI